jgi:hypothetical protein
MKTQRSKLFICTFFSILGSRFLPRLHSMWLVARKLILMITIISCGPATLYNIISCLYMFSVFETGMLLS